VSAQSKAINISILTNSRIAFSNLTSDIDDSVCLLCVVLLGGGFATELITRPRSPIGSL
jgi:hypothetical protein